MNEQNLTAGVGPLEPTVRPLADRMRECAEEVMSFPHPSYCDHLHVAHHVLIEAAHRLEHMDKGVGVTNETASPTNVGSNDGLGVMHDDERACLVLMDVQRERERQDAKWGGPLHDDQHNTADFVQLIEDYAGRARTMAGMSSHDKARHRLIQVAALAVAAVEALDRQVARWHTTGATA